jgi:hypothetical protein
MNTYVAISAPIINWHWSMILWMVALILGITLFTKLAKYTWQISVLFAFIGWLCAAYAGLTGRWFIGWFGWTPLLSGAIFINLIFQKLYRIPDESEKVGE